jgi:hypothetical protein
MNGQILVMAGVLIVFILIGTWDSLGQIDEFWNSQPIVTKVFFGIVLIAFGTVIYSYFDRSVKLQITTKKIESSDDVIKWEEVQVALVNHRQYHNGKIEITLVTGTKCKVDISGLELRPNEIANELSNYWSAWKQLKNA